MIKILQLFLLAWVTLTLPSHAQLNQREKADSFIPTINQNSTFVTESKWEFGPLNEEDPACEYSTSTLRGLQFQCIEAGSNLVVSQIIPYQSLREQRVQGENVVVKLKTDAFESAKVTVLIYSRTNAGALTLLGTRVFTHDNVQTSIPRSDVFEVSTLDIPANGSLQMTYLIERTGTNIAFGYVNEFSTRSSLINEAIVASQTNPDASFGLPSPITFISGGTKGTASVDEVYCGRTGQFMNLVFAYTQSVGTGGTTEPLQLAVPTSCVGQSGLTVDTSVKPTVGSFNIVNPTSTIAGLLRTNDGGNYIAVYASSSSPSVSILGNQLLNGSSYLRGSISIPITQWRGSTTSATTRSDYNNPRNHATLTARILTTGAQASPASGNNISWINGNCGSGTTKTCNFVAGIFTSVPDCTLTYFQNGADLGESVHGKIVSTSSITFASKGTSGEANRETVISCTKTGADLQAAYSPVINGVFQASSLTGMPKYIVKTFSSGNTWWDLYNNCWIEQGQNNRASTGSGNQTYTMTVPMASNNYSARKNNLSTSQDPTAAVTENIHTKTATTFQTWGNSSFDWVVRGLANSTWCATNLSN